MFHNQNLNIIMAMTQYIAGKTTGPKLQTFDSVNAMNYHRSGLYKGCYVWHRRRESGNDFSVFGFTCLTTIFQPLIQRIPGADSPRVKWPELEADNSSPTSEEVKNTLQYTSTPPYVFMA
jgi:hypothetical protein